MSWCLRVEGFVGNDRQKQLPERLLGPRLLVASKEDAYLSRLLNGRLTWSPPQLATKVLTCDDDAYPSHRLTGHLTWSPPQLATNRLRSLLALSSRFWLEKTR